MPSIINATTSTGLVSSADNSGSLQLATNNGTTAVTVTTAQLVGIGTTSPVSKLQIADTTATRLTISKAANSITNDEELGSILWRINGGAGTVMGNIYYTGTPTSTGDGTGALVFGARTNSGASTLVESMRIDSSGNVFVGKTSLGIGTAGIAFAAGNYIETCRSSGPALVVGRNTDDGDLVLFFQAGTQEGSISVSGSTVSYNGGHLSRWSQLPDNSKDDTILKGTVLTNLDDMCVWIKDGETLPNEQLNKMKVSDVEGDTNVAGVFVNWTRDEDCNSDDMNIAMTGDMIIRIAEGVVVQKGDLLMSAGDGTAKPQGDDIVRSKTIAKVTSNHVTCTYADGSYCVPCVLMAC